MFESIPGVEIARDVKGSEKGFCGYAGGERVTREDTGLMLNGLGDLLSKGRCPLCFSLYLQGLFPGS